MNLSKKVTYIITFLIIFLLLPFVGYKLYYKYESDLYLSLQEYSSYTTLDGKYSVMAMDTKQFGSEDSISLKIYLIDNESGEVSYICRKKQSTYGSEITYLEDKSDDAYNIIVTLSSGKVEIDCLNANKDPIANFLGR
jgi:hypothetical protein